MSSDENLLLVAAAEGNLNEVQRLLSAGCDAAAQDDVTGDTALMRAASGGHTPIVDLLLASGAPWNALNRREMCAGDCAMGNGHRDTVQTLLNAGVRSELILGAASRGLMVGGEAGADGGRGDGGGGPPSNLEYLSQRVEYSEGRLVDENKVGVMMGWERPLMEAHAKAVCQQGGHILNIGFGMGLVDDAIQRQLAEYKRKNPDADVAHTIVEAHPQVHARMIAEGWGEKEGVTIVYGRWQDQMMELESFDGIFFDTYGEYYDDMREFHECLPKLLKQPDGIYSFFNGMCGDNAFFHMVYNQIVELELDHLGFSTQLLPLPIQNNCGEKEWEGLERKYWQLDTYFLPFVVYKEVEETNDKQP